jgi:hypothetical protein
MPALVLAAFWLFLAAGAQTKPWTDTVRPSRVASEEHFPARPGRRVQPASLPAARAASVGATATWQPLGPAAVNTPSYGLVTGRVSAIAFDPADVTGNRVYIGTTGGGAWLSQNAATSNTGDVQFAPLIDNVGALTATFDASISVGALTVQPGATGVVLVGTGDPNDELDSYYGAGILRSIDGGNKWTLIQATQDQIWAFAGEGFAGFAWSTVNPQVVVAALSQALGAALTNAIFPRASFAGLYYSTDSGATWSIARVTDGGGADVQGPTDPTGGDGSAATSVIWNPVRKVFVAAVRYHGYYQSADGVTWTRLTGQPGTALTMAHCPTNQGTNGSPLCPIFRGTLAVNPQTGDTFAWTADGYNQDQGIWQDACALTAGACANAIGFSHQWSTTALQTNDPQQGPATIEEADSTLALAAVPSGQDTQLLAGADDVWKCSLAGGCAWRNTTQTGSCRSAQVAPYQHALVWSAANPQEMLIGNDSGLWRSLDAIGESGPECSASDATHFQNLNGGLGSLAEVQSFALAGTSEDAMVLGLGVNGTAGVKDASLSDWPQILSEYGGPVVVDPTNAANWYVNSGPGVAIHRCAQGDACTSADFSSVVTSADVGGDGDSMANLAPFLVDPLDPSQFLIGTCRVWRGPANGIGWSSANAISPFLDGMNRPACKGDPLIRSMAATAVSGGSEVIYVGMYGALEGGTTLAGHVLRAVRDPSSNAPPTWHDLTANPVTNDTASMNRFEFNISSIELDPHDATGNTLYVTVEGIPEPMSNLRTLYRSTDGGAHWQFLMSNLPFAPANSVAIDPQDANTVYVATNAGVYATQDIGNCITSITCWSAYAAGLPRAPVTQLSVSADAQMLVAGTYGRGMWQIPLWGAGTPTTSAQVSPSTLAFAAQAYGTASSPQTITVTNTGASALTIASIAVLGDFEETDDCQGVPVSPASSCTVQVVFAPSASGARTGQLTWTGNVSGGQVSVALSGTGTSSSGITLLPSVVNFGSVALGQTSTALQITVENATSAAVPVTSAAVTAPFVLTTNACGSSLAANSDCEMLIAFAPTQAGSASGTLTLVDGLGSQAAQLSGSGASPATDTLSAKTLTFAGTIVGQISLPQSIALTNSGGMPLTSIAVTASGPFQVASNCTTQLGAGGNCTLSVTFAPITQGAQTGILTVADLTRTQTVALSGTGLGAPQITVHPTALSFGPQAVGSPSAPLTLTVTNTGAAPMANVGFQLASQVASQVAGVSAAGFSVSSTCSGPLANGAACTAQVIFTPVSAGGASAILTVSSSTLGVKAAQVALTGSGNALSGLNVAPAQMAFTEATVGQASSAQSATITNAGTSPASGLVLTATAPFSLAQTNCGAALAPGSSCTASLFFTPTANGSASGAFTITSTTSNTAIVILSGAGGSAGSVQLQPSVLNFPATGLGAASSVQTVTVTNTGPVDLAALTLSVSSGYQLATTTCGSTLAPSASCSVGLVFSPNTGGQQSGSLTVNSGALAAPAHAELSGMGFDFSASIAGSASQTISSGQSASFVLALAPQFGASGTFSFQCASLPVSALCSFSPVNETVAANATGNVTVQITTANAASMPAPSHKMRRGALPALCVLLAFPLVWRRRRKALWLIAALALLGCGVSSCSGSGGGSGGTPGQGTAGVGTYSIPVSVASNGVVHTVTVKLTVD